MGAFKSPKSCVFPVVAIVTYSILLLTSGVKNPAHTPRVELQFPFGPPLLCVALPKSVESPKVAIVMGSQSDYSTMLYTQKVLKILKIKHEIKIVSAHRTPKRLYQFAKTAEKNNISVVIAGAGGSAHLPGMIAAITKVPVIGVPIESKKLKGLDSLLSIAQMPKGIPVGTVAIGKDGAINAGLFAASIIALTNSKTRKNLYLWRKKQTRSVKKKPK